MSRALAVWYRDQNVGRLISTGSRQMAFTYEPDWLTAGWAISCSLPLDETGDFLPPDLRGHNFFANLLPEGGARDRLVRRLGVADDDFLLLEKLGGDCAGALQLLPEGQPPSSLEDTCARIEDDVLEEAIRTGRGQWVAGEDPPRLSLAGAQDKVAVRASRQDGKWRFFLPEGGAASTHILKLPVQGLAHVPLYEAYTTFIATKLELPVAPVEVVRLGDHLLSLSERFDRSEQEGAILRLHQEDLCQAQGISRADKYTTASDVFSKVAELLKEHSIQPARDLWALANWQVFNALAGNADGHLKNVSILATEGGWKLAPFYDLVCTLAIPNVSHMMALPVGSKEDPQNLHVNHWIEFSKALGVSARMVKGIVERQAGEINEHADLWLDEFRHDHGDSPALQGVQQVIKRQAEKALRNWL